MPLTPALRSQRARIAALARWAKEDPKPTADRAQRGLRAKFERETREQFPDLSGPEFARRSDALYRAHMSRLAFASAKARSARAKAPKGRTDGGGPLAA